MKKQLHKTAQQTAQTAQLHKTASASSACAATVPDSKPVTDTAGQPSAWKVQMSNLQIF